MLGFSRSRSLEPLASSVKIIGCKHNPSFIFLTYCTRTFIEAVKEMTRISTHVFCESMTMVGISSVLASSCDAATDNETANRATFRSMSPSAAQKSSSVRFN